jgi:hypothetical protein
VTDRLYPDDDPIMEELYRIRAERLAEYGGDWKAMLRDIYRLQEEEKARGVKYVKLPPKQAASAAESPREAG